MRTADVPSLRTTDIKRENLTSGGSGRRFEKVRHTIVMGLDGVLLKNDAGIAPMIGPMQAHVQNDLAPPHAGWRSIGEDELHGLVEIALR